jgi:hypothetical protein
MTEYEEVDRVKRNRVSTKSQLGADSVSSGRCVKRKTLHFLTKNARPVKSAVKPSKAGTKN